MGKIGTVFAICVTFMSADAVNLTIDEGKRAEYGSALANVISYIQTGNTMLDWSKNKLTSASRILEKTSVSTEDYGQVCSIVMSVLPSFSHKEERVLSKILTFSLFHVLKEDVYDFIGSSFYPEDEDLDAIMLEGKKLTSVEFIQIQAVLEKDLEDGIVDNGSFSKALDSIKKRRGE
ncbi:MAG: hypothetical protein LBG04_03130 [Holosporaceae bacterium]|jgi:hypothetical protein|nr:hypothetical protein [Holosporaceae bacterium]